MPNPKLIDPQWVIDKLASSSETWCKGTPRSIQSWWAHAVKVKDNIVELINSAPAYEETPAKWEGGRFNTQGEYTRMCSNCSTWSIAYGCPYCPHCGKPMIMED